MKASPTIRTLIVCTMLLPSCLRETARLLVLGEQVDALESARRDLARQLSEQRRLVQAASAERDLLMVERSRVEALIGTTGDEINALKSEFADYKADYRHAIQARAKGMALPSLNVGAKHYENTTVRSVTDTELTIVTAQGITRLPLASTPPDIQELFGYDPNSGFASIAAPSGFDYLADAILAGKQNAADNKRLIEEAKGLKKRKSPPKYLRAPSKTSSSSGKPHSSFEGSFYAPLR